MEPQRFRTLDGRPHAYVVCWREDLDDWEEEYQLTPITAEQLALVLEDWAIWQRWESAFCAGETTLFARQCVDSDRSLSTMIELDDCCFRSQLLNVLAGSLRRWQASSVFIK